jgi:hypothetical protein
MRDNDHQPSSSQFKQGRTPGLIKGTRSQWAKCQKKKKYGKTE